MKIMGKNKVLVKVNPEGKYVVDLDKSIDIAQVTPGSRVALKNDSYTLHFLLPTKVSNHIDLHVSFSAVIQMTEHISCDLAERLFYDSK